MKSLLDDEEIKAICNERVPGSDSYQAHKHWHEYMLIDGDIKLLRRLAKKYGYTIKRRVADDD